MNKINYIDKLKECDLDILSIVLTYADLHKRNKILADIKTQINVDFEQELNSEDIEKLKVFQNAHKNQLIQIISEFKDYDDSPTAKHHRLLDFIILGVGFVYIFFILIYPINENAIRFADTVLGVVIGTMITSVVSYWYDGTASKGRKNDKYPQNRDE